MITWRDVSAAHERSQDLMREAEKERLIRQFKAEENNPTFWQRIGGLLRNLKEADQPCGSTPPPCPDLAMGSR